MTRAARTARAAEAPAYSRAEMKRLLEAVLFAADKPVPVGTLCQILDRAPEAEVRATLAEMAKEYEEWGRSFILKEVAGGFLMYSHPAFEPWVRKLFRGRLTLRLSRSALETVAIIAYRQPVTKQDVETVRGVNADGVLHTLLERRLIRVVGRKEGMGRALLYGTTPEFLQYMGLNDLTELPQLEEMKTILEAQEPGMAPPMGPFAGAAASATTASVDTPVAAAAGPATAAKPPADGEEKEPDDEDEDEEDDSDDGE